MGVPFVMSLTTMRAKENNIAAVFVDLRLGTECEVLWFLLVGRTLLKLHRAFYLEDLLPGCLGDQESCESEELVLAELAELSAKPFNQTFS